MSHRFLWLTDIHLNFLTREHVVEWAKYCGKQAANEGCEGVIITGDISEAPILEDHLKIVHENIRLPIHYVMGNHDYWGTDSASLHQLARKMRQENEQISWLGEAGVVRVSDKTAIVGHDGWYDAGYGDWTRSNIYMNDWVRVHDFIPVANHRSGIVALARKFAGEAAAYVYDRIGDAIAAGHTNIVVATHFPPFEEGVRHQGAHDPSSTPWYASKAMGNVIRMQAEANPGVQFLVMSGHTHATYAFDPLPNVKFFVQGSEYGQPGFKIIQVEK